MGERLVKLFRGHRRQIQTVLKGSGVWGVSHMPLDWYVGSRFCKFIPHFQRPCWVPVAVLGVEGAGEGDMGTRDGICLWPGSEYFLAALLEAGCLSGKYPGLPPEVTPQHSGLY